jgi:hypothetical protein
MRELSEKDKARRRDVRIHTVSGTYIRCCEQGETDCPCICHDEPAEVPA